VDAIGNKAISRYVNDVKISGEADFFQLKRLPQLREFIII
jgi:hypothetical protein